MRERYLTAKELSAALADIGIRRSERWIRLSWKLKGAPHLQFREVRLGEFLEWMQKNPGARVSRRDEGRRIPMRML